MFNEKNIIKEPIIGKKINEKNPSPEEMLEKEQRKVTQLIAMLREQGIEVDEKNLEK